MRNTVGILALQGDFLEHELMLQSMGVKTVQVRLPRDLENIDRLIIPGGESTTIGKLMDMYGLLEPIRKRTIEGMPLWGTCAGAILMAKHIADGKKDGQPSLSLMNITARRNAFGRQVDSFEINLLIKELGEKPFSATFIRAPLLENPGKNVKVLAKLDTGGIVAAQQDKIIATCFHPELTQDARFHKYFLTL